MNVRSPDVGRWTDDLPILEIDVELSGLGKDLGQLLDVVIACGVQ